MWRYLSNTRKYREFHVNKVWSIESCLSNIDIPVYISKRKVEDQMNLTYRRVFPWQRVLCKISDVCHLWLLFKSFSKRWHLLYMQSFCFWRSIQSMIGSRSDKQKIIKPFLNLIPQRKWKEWKKIISGIYRKRSDIESTWNIVLISKQWNNVRFAAWNLIDRWKRKKSYHSLVILPPPQKKKMG